MPKRATGNELQRKKTQRLASLRGRRAQSADRFKALEHRQRVESTRLQAARKRCASSSSYRSVVTIDRRRDEYVEIPRTASIPTPPRFLVASLAAAFVLPLLIALASNFAQQPENVVQTQVRQKVAQRSLRTPHAQPVKVALRPARKSEQHATNVQRVAALPHTINKAPTVHPASTPKVIATQSKPVQPAMQPSRVIATLLNAMFGSPSQPAATQHPKPEPATPAAQAPPQVVAQNQPEQEQPARHIHPTNGLLAKNGSPWTITPDGTWTAVVRAPGADRGVDFSASTGQLIVLEPTPGKGAAATVTVGWSRPVVVTMAAPAQTWTRTLPAPDDSLQAFQSSARAVGPHLINVGWTPLAASAAVVDYKVYRSIGESDQQQLVATLSPIKHSWRDSNVDPDTTYQYSVVAETEMQTALAPMETASTPDELPSSGSSVLAGKGMFLYFSSLPNDARSFHRYDPEAVIAEAHKAGIHVIELRMARGSCAMAQTDAAHAWLDRFVDAAAASDIKLIAWTVPRRVTTDDLAQTLAATSYRTPAGNGFVGLALDLESGDHYMGDGPKARAYMVQYIKTVRMATGRHYLIVATVASPAMRHYTNDDYPYARIAAYADVLQPMEYWHYFEETSHHDYESGEVAGAAAATVARTKELAGRDIPVDVAGQTVDLQGTGAPSGSEILWSLKGSKAVGAIGETFFDWAGTRPDAWAAIQAFDW